MQSSFSDVNVDPESPVPAATNAISRPSETKNTGTGTAAATGELRAQRGQVTNAVRYSTSSTGTQNERSNSVGEALNIPGGAERRFSDEDWQRRLSTSTRNRNSQVFLINDRPVFDGEAAEVPNGTRQPAVGPSARAPANTFRPSGSTSRSSFPRWSRNDSVQDTGDSYSLADNELRRADAAEASSHGMSGEGKGKLTLAEQVSRLRSLTSQDVYPMTAVQDTRQRTSTSGRTSGRPSIVDVNKPENEATAVLSARHAPPSKPQNVTENEEEAPSAHGGPEQELPSLSPLPEQSHSGSCHERAVGGSEIPTVKTIPSIVDACLLLSTAEKSEQMPTGCEDAVAYAKEGSSANNSLPAESPRTPVAEAETQPPPPALWPHHSVSTAFELTPRPSDNMLQILSATVPDLSAPEEHSSQEKKVGTASTQLSVLLTPIENAALESAPCESLASQTAPLPSAEDATLPLAGPPLSGKRAVDADEPTTGTQFHAQSSGAAPGMGPQAAPNPPTQGPLPLQIAQFPPRADHSALNAADAPPRSPGHATALPDDSVPQNLLRVHSYSQRRASSRRGCKDEALFPSTSTGALPSALQPLQETAVECGPSSPSPTPSVRLTEVPPMLSAEEPKQLTLLEYIQSKRGPSTKKTRYSLRAEFILLCVSAVFVSFTFIMLLLGVYYWAIQIQVQSARGVTKYQQPRVGALSRHGFTLLLGAILAFLCVVILPACTLYFVPWRRVVRTFIKSMKLAAVLGRLFQHVQTMDDDTLMSYEAALFSRRTRSIWERAGVTVDCGDGRLREAQRRLVHSMRQANADVAEFASLLPDNTMQLLSIRLQTVADSSALTSGPDDTPGLQPSSSRTSHAQPADAEGKTEHDAVEPDGTNASSFLITASPIGSTVLTRVPSSGRRGAGTAAVGLPRVLSLHGSSSQVSGSTSRLPTPRRREQGVLSNRTRGDVRSPTRHSLTRGVSSGVLSVSAPIDLGRTGSSLNGSTMGSSIGRLSVERSGSYGANPYEDDLGKPMCVVACKLFVPRLETLCAEPVQSTLTKETVEEFTSAVTVFLTSIATAAASHGGEVCFVEADSAVVVFNAFQAMSPVTMVPRACETAVALDAALTQSLGSGTYEKLGVSWGIAVHQCRGVACVHELQGKIKGYVRSPRITDAMQTAALCDVLHVRVLSLDSSVSGGFCSTVIDRVRFVKQWLSAVYVWDAYVYHIEPLKDECGAHDGGGSDGATPHQQRADAEEVRERVSKRAFDGLFHIMHHRCAEAKQLLQSLAGEGNVAVDRLLSLADAVADTDKVNPDAALEPYVRYAPLWNVPFDDDMAFARSMSGLPVVSPPTPLWSQGLSRWQRANEPSDVEDGVPRSRSRGGCGEEGRPPLQESAERSVCGRNETAIFADVWKSPGRHSATTRESKESGAVDENETSERESSGIQQVDVAVQYTPEPAVALGHNADSTVKPAEAGCGSHGADKTVTFNADPQDSTPLQVAATPGSVDVPGLQVSPANLSLFSNQDDKRSTGQLDEQTAALDCNDSFELERLDGHGGPQEGISPMLPAVLPASRKTPVDDDGDRFSRSAQRRARRQSGFTASGGNDTARLAHFGSLASPSVNRPLSVSSRLLSRNGSDSTETPTTAMSGDTKTAHRAGTARQERSQVSSNSFFAMPSYRPRSSVYESGTRAVIVELPTDDKNELRERSSANEIARSRVREDTPDSGEPFSPFYTDQNVSATSAAGSDAGGGNSILERGRYTMPRFRLCHDTGERGNRGRLNAVTRAISSKGFNVAVKRLENDAYGRREVEIFSQLEDENILRYIGCDTRHEHCLYMVMELVTSGSLADVLTRFMPLPTSSVKCYARQTLRALSYMHENGVVHRDVSINNIMVSCDGLCKLCDFGGSLRLRVDPVSVSDRLTRSRLSHSRPPPFSGLVSMSTSTHQTSHGLDKTELPSERPQSQVVPPMVSPLLSRSERPLSFLSEELVPLASEISHANCTGSSTTDTTNDADSDAELSETVNEKEEYRSVFGTPVFMSPQACRGIVDRKNDVWSLGIVVYYCLTGTFPYPDTYTRNADHATAAALIAALASGELLPDVPVHAANSADRKDAPGSTSPLDENALDFVRCCLQAKLRNRSSAEDLLQHVFVNT